MFCLFLSGWEWWIRGLRLSSFLVLISKPVLVIETYKEHMLLLLLLVKQVNYVWERGRLMNKSTQVMSFDREEVIRPCIERRETREDSLSGKRTRGWTWAKGDVLSSQKSGLWIGKDREAMDPLIAEQKKIIKCIMHVKDKQLRGAWETEDVCRILWWCCLIAEKNGFGLYRRCHSSWMWSVQVASFDSVFFSLALVLENFLSFTASEHWFMVLQWTNLMSWCWSRACLRLLHYKSTQFLLFGFLSIWKYSGDCAKINVSTPHASMGFATSSYWHHC